MCLFNQLVYCMAIFTNKNKKQAKIFTVIYYKMPIPCNDMVNSIEKANIKGACGILWYPAVSCGNQTDPISCYRLVPHVDKAPLPLRI